VLRHVGFLAGVFLIEWVIPGDSFLLSQRHFFRSLNFGRREIRLCSDSSLFSQRHSFWSLNFGRREIRLCCGLC
jgi:hypothetical protein